MINWNFKRIIVIGTLIFCIVNCVAQNNFKTLMTYDIKGISVNNKLICPLNGFNHGTVDYGIYKQRGLYFAITFDNAVLGEGVMLLEVVDFENFDKPMIKGMNCTLIEMNKANSKTFKGSFIESKKEGIVQLILDDKVNGQDVVMTYIMTPKDSK